MSFNYSKDPMAVKTIIFIVCILIVSTMFYPEYWYIDLAVAGLFAFIFWAFRNWQ